MQSKLPYFFLFIIGCICYDESYSQDFTDPNRRINFEDGLIDDSATCFEKDSLGYMWIGTTGGLNRYNGDQFKHWTVEDSLSSNWILSLEYDHDQNWLWIGTSNGLNYMDLNDYRIYTFQEEKPSSFNISKEWITGVIKIKSNKFWCYNNGIVEIDPVSKKSYHYTFPYSNKSNIVTQVLNDLKQPELSWLGTADGIISFDNVNMQAIEHYQLKHPNKEFESNINLVETFLFQDEMGIIYGGCLTGGILMLNPTTKEVSSFQKVFQGIDFSNDVIYKQIIPFKKDQLLIFTNVGILVYDNRKEKILDYFPTDDFKPRTFAPSYKDESDRIWISSQGGINIYELKDRRFEIIALDQNILGKNFQLKSFIEDKKNGLLYFIKDQGREVYAFDLETKKLLAPLNNFADINKDKQFSLVTVDIELTQRGDLYLLCDDQLFILKKDKWHPTKILPPLEMLPFVSLTELHDGQLLVASIYNGFFVYHPMTKETQYVPSSELLGDGYWIYDIYRDPTDGFWVSQLGRGLTHFDKDLNKDHQIAFREPGNDLGHFSIKDFSYIDEERFIFCGASKGIYLASKEGIIEKIGSKNIESIHAFEFDDNDNLWMLAKDGLIKSPSNLDTQLFISYPDPSFNFTSDLIQGRQLIKLSDEKMIFSGKSSFSYFNPHALKVNHDVRKPIIDFISTNESNYQVSNTKEKMELPFKENVISFHFHDINFKNDFIPAFSYWLEGVDQTWSPATTTNVIKYSNLSPRRYTFKLRTSNEDKIWCSTPTEMSFHILPPWWRTWWASICYLCLGVFAFFLWNTYQKNKWQLEFDLFAEKEKNAQLILQTKSDRMNALLKGAEDEKERLSRELHDGVGAVLASASMFIESLGHKFKGLKEDEHFHKSKKLVSQSCDEVRSLSHTLMPLSIRRIGFVHALEEMFDNFSNGNDIEYRTKIDVDESLINETIQQNVHRIIQEICKNILQHAGANSVDIDLSIKANFLLLTLQNDGRDFNVSESLKADGLGLKNILHRIEVMDGSIDINKLETSGMRYEISIPLTYINTQEPNKA